MDGSLVPRDFGVAAAALCVIYTCVLVCAIRAANKQDEEDDNVQNGPRLTRVNGKHWRDRPHVPTNGVEDKGVQSEPRLTRVNGKHWQGNPYEPTNGGDNEGVQNGPRLTRVNGQRRPGKSHEPTNGDENEGFQNGPRLTRVDGKHWHEKPQNLPSKFRGLRWFMGKHESGNPRG